MLNRLRALLVAAVMCEDGGPRRGLPERPRIRVKQGSRRQGASVQSRSAQVRRKRLPRPCVSIAFITRGRHQRLIAEESSALSALVSCLC